MTNTNGQPGSEKSADIERQIRTVLRSEPRLSPQFKLEELKVEDDGVILLRGEVPDVATKKIALQHVAKIPSIRAIADHLHVKPAATMQDDEIRIHVRNGLIGEAGFEGIEIREFDDGTFQLIRGAPVAALGDIGIEVSKGVVILTGNVPSLTSKRLAGVIAWWVPGFRDVINGLAVEPDEEDGPDRIAEAVRIVLEKEPYVDADQVKVGVRKTVVRLTGAVRSETERRAAERDAWMIFAVDDVINEIDIRP
jgi:osmotically-inducible protein OsmY